MATTVNRPQRTMGFLLDGRWHQEGDCFEVLSPFTRTNVGSTFRASEKHLETAIQAAVRSLEVTRRLPAHERRRPCNASQRNETAARLIAPPGLRR